MASYERRSLENTSIATGWKVSKLNKETTQNSISSFRYSLPMDETLWQSWNETQNISAENNHCDLYDTYGVVSFKFCLFNFDISDLTSEMFQKSIVILGLIIGFLGVVGNFVTICKILHDKKFHTPTFVAIGCIVIPDLLNIVSLFLIRSSKLFLYLLELYISSESVVSFITVKYLIETVFYSSSAHIVFLCMIRYLLIAYPLQSKIRLTPAVIVGCSLMIWVFCSLFSAFISILLFVPDRDSIPERHIAILLIRITFSGLPICTILTLQIMKMKVLKKSSAPTSISRRMNVIISIILLVFFCFQTSYILCLIFPLIISISVEQSILMRIAHAYALEMFFFFGTLNFSCNPYALFIASIIFSCNKRNQIKYK